VVRLLVSRLAALGAGHSSKSRQTAPTDRVALFNLHEKTFKMTMTTQQNGVAPNGASPAKRHEEYQYLDLIREILEEGEERPDR
jgi:hypothetical protein